MKDRIEKQIEIKAPLSRVWRAITDHRAFGEWFGVKIDGPFVEGQVSRGRMTHPGYEHVKWEAAIEKIEPEQLFCFTWAHPKSFDPATYSGDYSQDPRTLVEFKLEKTNDGTLLRIIESGFDQLPADLRLEAFRRNEGGWTVQVQNLENYVAKKA
jgi:uncharacterized protein YndB with AHSA1/START domain